MQEIFAMEACQMNYVKYLDLINYGKQATATVFTETLVQALNITLSDYWYVTTKLRSQKMLSLNMEFSMVWTRTDVTWRKKR